MKNVILFVTGVLVLVMLAACSPAPVVENAGSSGGETAVMPQSSDNMAADDHSEAVAESEEAMSDEPMADESMSDEAMSDDAMSDDAMSDEAMSDDAMSDEAMSDEAMSDEAMSDDAMSDDAMSDDAMMDLPAWQTIALTNAATGETFTLADYAGKTVFVEPMATWCTNCRRQLANVREARSQLGDDVVFIGLSLETNISDAQLATYQTNEGFDWTFAVMTPELLQSLADTFGRSITNAPATPHFIIRPDGSYTDLATGIDAPDVLVQQIQAAQ